MRARSNGIGISLWVRPARWNYAVSPARTIVRVAPHLSCHNTGPFLELSLLSTMKRVMEEKVAIAWVFFPPLVAVILEER